MSADIEAHIRAALEGRGGVQCADQNGHYWMVALSDDTRCEITFDDTKLFGPLESWEWYVAHIDKKDEEIGGGNWDFAGALESLDGYIADPGWDRAET